MSDQATEVQTKLDEIREAKAERERVFAQAQDDEAAKNAALDQAKAHCAEACGPIAEILAATEDPEEQAALVELEAQTHAIHAGELEAAYLTFAGQRVGDSNPATPGETGLGAEVHVTSESES